MVCAASVSPSTVFIINIATGRQVFRCDCVSIAQHAPSPSQACLISTTKCTAPTRTWCIRSCFMWLGCRIERLTQPLVCQTSLTLVLLHAIHFWDRGNVDRLQQMQVDLLYAGSTLSNATLGASRGRQGPRVTLRHNRLSDALNLLYSGASNKTSSTSYA